MAASEDTQLEVLNDHYNNTCEIVKEYLKKRDWMFFSAIVLLIFQLFQISNPAETSDALIKFIKSSYGIEISIGRTTLEAILWFVLLAVIVRYYQAVIHINKQYSYLHRLEAEFSKLFDRNLITREGKSYLKDYPAFSDWIHFIYTWAYPVFLILILTRNIFFDWKNSGGLDGPYGISIACYFVIVTSTVLYLIFCHRIKKNYEKNNIKNVASN